MSFGYDPSASPSPSRSVGQRRARRLVVAATAALLAAGLIYTAAFGWTTWVGWLVLGLGAVIAAGITLAVDESLPPTEFLFDLDGYLTDLPTRRLRFEGSRTSDLGVAFDYPGVRNIWNSYPRHGPWGNPPTTHPFAPVRPDGPTSQVHPSRRAW